ncbi:MAG: alpha-amylase family glycosyl hydrolase [Cyanobium sp.]
MSTPVGPKSIRWRGCGWLCAAALSALGPTATTLAAVAAPNAGAPAASPQPWDDGRVLLQGFYWESYRHGKARFPEFGQQPWYEVVRSKVPAIAAGRFDLIWLPPPMDAGELSAGYNPREYFKFDTSYGNKAQQQQLLRALLAKGVEPIADVVINHRDGGRGWADFQNPAWGTQAICATDEAFSNPTSGLASTPIAKRGTCEEPVPYRPGRTFNYDSFRDINHGDPVVRKDILRYLLQLKALGYRGWRYDMVHGYSARWVGCYNAVTQPSLAVGEYDWDKQGELRGGLWATATQPHLKGADHLRSASYVFDFPGFFRLKEAITASRYGDLYAFHFGHGLMGDTTDGMPWKQRAVTFAENHDTGYRTNDDGTPQKGHQFDSFAKGWQVEQAYAYLLTHPGVPSVYWKHYFDWGADLQRKIQAMVNARKVAGVHAGSALHVQQNARQAGVYAAAVQGRQGMLYVRVGGDDGNWQPAASGYSGFREYGQGQGWKVWVALPGNPPVRSAPLASALPAPGRLQPLPAALPPLCGNR